ncbi:MAG: hypothetical protein WCO51_09045 [bacterium]
MSQRRSEVVEQLYAQAITLFVIGLVVLGTGYVLLKYFCDYVSVLAWLLLLGGTGGLLFGAFRCVQSLQVGSYEVICPYCWRPQVLTAIPLMDFHCDDCHRIVPVVDGKALEASPIDCSNCGTTNFYTAASTSLICESCSGPIALPSAIQISPPKVLDDNTEYEVVLLELGKDPDKVIDALVQLLRMTYEHVVGMLKTFPVSLFQGVNKHRSELLIQYLTELGALVEARPVKSNRI